MSVAANSRIITAIVPEDLDTLALATALHERFGSAAAFRHFGRGVGRTTRRFGRMPLIPERRTLFSVVVAADLADAIFAWLETEARINRRGGGLLYEQCLDRILTDP